MKQEKMKYAHKLDTFITAAIVAFYLAAFMTTLYFPPEAIVYSIAPVDFIRHIALKLLGYYCRSVRRRKQGR